VMKGGLNYWFSTIMKSTPPPATAPSQYFDIHNIRLAARQYFTGGASSGTDQGGAATREAKKGSEKVKVNKKETSYLR
jgi:hypothetical protein